MQTMTNLEKLIETLQNAPIERTACFINSTFVDSCRFCTYGKECFEKTTDNEGIIFTICEAKSQSFITCEKGIKQWLESEADKC